jgi:hypothetical protein
MLIASAVASFLLSFRSEAEESAFPTTAPMSLLCDVRYPANSRVAHPSQSYREG